MQDRHLRQLILIAATAQTLLGPFTYSLSNHPLATAHAPLGAGLSWLAAGLLSGGFTNLMLGRYRLSRWLDRAWRLAASLPLAAGAVALGRAGVWWAALLFVSLFLISAIAPWFSGEGDVTPRRSAVAAAPAVWDAPPEQLERNLELWLWLLAFSVVLVAPRSQDGTLVTWLTVDLFVATVTLYNLIAFHLLGGRGSPQQRLTLHMAFLTIATGVLVADEGLIGHALIGPFLLTIPLSARYLGMRRGLAIVGLAAGALVTGGLEDWLLRGSTVGMAVWQTSFELAGLVTTAIMGVGAALVQRRGAVELAAAKQTLQREVRLRQLSETITIAIRSSLEVDRILQTTVNELGAALAVDRCTVRLRTTGEVEEPAHQYVAEGVPLLEHYRPQMLVAPMQHSGRAVAISDVATDPILGAPDSADRQLALDLQIKSILVAPIIAEDHLLGTIAFHQLSHVRHWERDEIAFLEGVAGQVAVAIVHAQSHRELGDSLEELQAAHEELQAREEELIAQQEELQAQQEELEEALEQTRQAEAAHSRLSSILEATSDLVAMSDTYGHRLYMNRAGRAMLGFDPDSPIEGQEIGEVHPEWARKVVMSEAIPTALRQGIWRGETAYLGPDGREIPVSQVVIAHQGLDGGPTYISTIARDITERKQFEQQLMRLASYDPLTDMFNRRRFEEELAHHVSLAERYGTVGALLFIDLDQFKYINDSLGHQAGDLFLKGLASMLRRRLRKTDVLARLGGDEFAVLLPQTDQAQAQRVADEIRKAIRQHTQVISGQPISTTASIGVAIFPEHGRAVEELLSRADMAMYQAKEHGRNRFHLFAGGESEQERVTAKLTWERRIREALAHDRFVLHHQPILDLSSGKIVRHELLLRMRDEEGNLIMPMAFLDTAERFGLIRAIDRWVVRRAIHLIAEQSRHNPEICLEVNLSGRAFEDPELLSVIEQELTVTGIDPRALVLEITETAAIADLEQASQFISTLKGLGCRFAIDDFGSGFASFYYLKHLPVDYLKLDGSFIRNLPNDPVDQHLVRAMVEVARGLGIRTIAEFVESEETVRLLRQYGVDFAQGYHIGRPEPLPGCCPEAAGAVGLD